MRNHTILSLSRAGRDHGGASLVLLGPRPPALARSGSSANMGPGGHDSGRVVGGARASVAPVRMETWPRGALGLLRVLPRRVPPVGKHVAAVALVDRRAAPAAAAVMAPLAPAIAAAEVAPFRVPMRLKCEFSDVMEYNTIYNIFGNIVNFRLAEALLRA